MILGTRRLNEYFDFALITSLFVQHVTWFCSLMRKREVNKYRMEKMKKLIESLNDNESHHAFPGVKRKKKRNRNLKPDVA